MSFVIIKVLQKKYIMDCPDHYEFREIKDKDELITLSRLTHTTHARKLFQSHLQYKKKPQIQLLTC